MNESIGRPEIGQWYARTDKGEWFQVVGRDDDARTVEVQTYDGDLDEIEADTWATLPLERCEPPEDGGAAFDIDQPDDLGYTETAMNEHDWSDLREGLRAQGESWQDTEPEDERDPLGDGSPVEPYTVDEAAARAVV